MEKYCEEFNSLSEDVILDIIKGKGPTVVKQENLIIHGMNGKPITARTENQQLLVKGFREQRSGFRHRTCRFGQNIRRYRPSRKSIKE